jgi:hypothetical protein
VPARSPRIGSPAQRVRAHPPSLVRPRQRRAYPHRELAAAADHATFFIPPGAEAFKRDIPKARIVFLDTGHFALETRVNPIAEEIRGFF